MPFITDFEARRKYLTVSINGKPVRLQLDTASDISLISKRTWQRIGRPRMTISDKKAMNVSGGFLRLTGELDCDVSFESTQFKGTCYLTNHRKLDLNDLDWIEKLGLLDLPLNRFCNGVQSAWPSPAKSNQVTTNLMSTPSPHAKVPKKKEEDPGQKAPASFVPRQTPGHSTRSGARKRRGASTKSPSSFPTTAADSLDLSTRNPRVKKA
ncbi:unnamed protein product [Dibothriocephalus latus]|uniref:Peptidase A2 domain-containing protein n=1 Tax=Dibothriocephalus latus TaxID=60516 RepID=A0A3P7LSP9_DIBLA|nr:unnamed protein product [Dibothriocephalus latus]